MGSSVKKIWEWCRHYISVTFIIVVVFVVIVLFFNENSILKSMEYLSLIHISEPTRPY